MTDVAKQEVCKTRTGEVTLPPTSEVDDGKRQPVGIFIPVLLQYIDSRDDQVLPFRNTDRVGEAVGLAVDAVEVLRGNTDIRTAISALDGQTFNRTWSGAWIGDIDDLRIADRLAIHLQAAVAVVVQA